MRPPHAHMLCTTRAGKCLVPNAFTHSLCSLVHLDRFREIFPVLQGSRRMEAAHRTHTMVRFIQLLCEGQYIEMKNYLTWQPDPGLVEGASTGTEAATSGLAAAAVSGETKSGDRGGAVVGGDGGGDDGAGPGGRGVVVEKWVQVNILSKVRTEHGRWAFADRLERKL